MNNYTKQRRQGECGICGEKKDGNLEKKLKLKAKRGYVYMSILIVSTMEGTRGNMHVSFHYPFYKEGCE